VTTQQSSTPTTRDGQNGLAVGSLVTGIIGVIFAFLIPIIGLVLGIVSVALGAVARRNGNRSGQTTAGLLLGVLAIVVSVANMVIAYNIMT
jgi:hypothetical protein